MLHLTVPKKPLASFAPCGSGGKFVLGSDFDRLITIQCKVRIRADAKHDKCEGIWQKNL